ncbi:MAG: hypothetical protein LBO06_05530 [Bacteroidales bacterium]|jgi:hypothetical protein|nr:hypothetical protein [Bacteroidales bacterium]
MKIWTKKQEIKTSELSEPINGSSSQSSEVYAVIAMALYEATQQECHNDKIDVMPTQRKASRKSIWNSNNNSKGLLSGEVCAAIAMALYDANEDEYHDDERAILTIQRRTNYSLWNSKINTLR